MTTHIGTVSPVATAIIGYIPTVGSISVAVAILLGLYLVVRGLFGLFRRGEVPFLKRRGMFAKVAAGAFLICLPAVSRMTMDNVPPGNLEIPLHIGF